MGQSYQEMQTWTAKHGTSCIFWFVKNAEKSTMAKRGTKCTSEWIYTGTKLLIPTTDIWGCHDIFICVVMTNLKYIHFWSVIKTVTSIAKKWSYISEKRPNLSFIEATSNAGYLTNTDEQACYHDNIRNTRAILRGLYNTEDWISTIYAWKSI